MAVQDLVIYGASFPDVLKIVASVNDREPTWRIVGFLDDYKFGHENAFFGVPILGGAESIARFRDDGCRFLNNVFGSRDGRLKVAERLDGHQVPYATVAAAGVNLAMATLGEGCLISEGVVFGAGVTVGDHVGIRAQAAVNHESSVGDHAFVGPAAVACGRVSIGAEAMIGAGAVIRDHIHVGDRSRVAMGAVVNADVADDDVVAGNPARSVRGLLR
jgi:sugar O-acyltransferase (sialic acid O-acetyltransferase NeuD family)